MFKKTNNAKRLVLKNHSLPPFPSPLSQKMPPSTFLLTISTLLNDKLILLLIDLSILDTFYSISIMIDMDLTLLDPTSPSHSPPNYYHFNEIIDK